MCCHSDAQLGRVMCSWHRTERLNGAFWHQPVWKRAVCLLMFSLVSELMNDILLHFHVPRYRSGLSLQSGLNAQGELAGEPVSALLNP